MAKRIGLEYERVAVKNFESPEDYIEHIYNINKVKIDAAFSDSPNPKGRFKATWREYREELDLSPRQAVEAMSRTTTFLPEADRYKQNLVKAFKSFPEAEKKFKKMLEKEYKERGLTTKPYIRKDKIKWDAENKRYIYDDKYYLQFKKTKGRSPDILKTGKIRRRRR